MSAVYGADGKARRVIVPSVKIEPLRDGDEKDPKKLIKVINALIEQSARNAPNIPLSFAEFEDIEVTGKPGVPQTVYLRHGFGSRVRWWVDAVKYLAPSPSDTQQSWIDRQMGLGTWTVAAGNFTLGVRMRLKRKREIVGVRFGWRDPGANASVACRIWNDATGALLATTETVLARNTGVYEAMFPAPLTTDMTGFDVVLGYYSPSYYSYTTDATWNGFVPIEIDRDTTLKDVSLFAAGNARPATASGGVSRLVEPIYGRRSPLFEEHADTDENTLALSAHDAGKFTFRVTPAGT